MKSGLFSFRAFLLMMALALMANGTLRGQPTTAGDVAIVSRMCLWNADKATWAKVGLSKAQVRKMQAIRARYPAVVEGQWILTGTDEPVDHAGPGASDGNGPVPTTNGDATATKGLQAEVRAVLTPLQVNKWMALCNRIARR